MAHTANKYDFYCARAPKCPHCGAIYRTDGDSPSGIYEDEAIVSVACEPCGKDFVVTVSLSFKYTSYTDEDAVGSDEFGPREATEATS